MFLFFCALMVPPAGCRARDGDHPAASGPSGGQPAGPRGAPPADPPDRQGDGPPAADLFEESWLVEARQEMVTSQIEARGVRDVRVLQAMRTVPRHRFVPERLVPVAYRDHPLPIGEQQTISQPYIVALMSELLEVRPGEKVLEVGTGSGYQAAVLSAMGAEVYSIEIVEPLAAEAERRLRATGFTEVHLRTGDGYRGWPEAAPFDGIIVTAAPGQVPQLLVDQLAPGGRMVIPVGSAEQVLTVLTRTPAGILSERNIPVRFVPMTGEARGDPSR
jgi:protein-L-isoaspartate(D-aspartate) O-methyltransferase